MLGCAGGCRGAFFHCAKPNVLNKSGMTKLRLLIMTLIVPRKVANKTRVAPALLPVLASYRRTLLRRQECLCHTSQNDESNYFVVAKMELYQPICVLGHHLGETTRPYSEARLTRSK